MQARMSAIDPKADIHSQASVTQTTKWRGRSSLLDQFAAAGLTTSVPLIVVPWILQWSFTGLEVSPGLISPVSKVLPSSSEVAVCFENALLVHSTEPPTGTSTLFGS